MVLVIKNLPAIREIQGRQVRSLGQEDPLQEEMATQSSVLTWKIQWTEAPGELQSVEFQKDWDVTEYAGTGIMLHIILVGKEYSRMLNNLPRITQVERDPEFIPKSTWL